MRYGCCGGTPDRRTGAPLLRSLRGPLGGQPGRLATPHTSGPARQARGGPGRMVIQATGPAPAGHTAGVEHLAERLAAVPGVVAVTLGGSRATGTAAADSDWDVGLYYDGSLDPAGIAALGWPGRVFAPGRRGAALRRGARRPRRPGRLPGQPHPGRAGHRPGPDGRGRRMGAE